MASSITHYEDFLTNPEKYLNPEESWDYTEYATLLQKFFEMIVKPEQSGKTWQMLKIIRKIHSLKKEGRMINIIFCANNLLLTKQTNARFAEELGEDSYIEFSSKSKTGHTNKKMVLADLMLKDNIYNVICCTNSVRMGDIVNIIQTLRTMCKDSAFRGFTIWMDEADEYIQYIIKNVIPIVEECQVKVKLITATPLKLFDKLGDLPVIGMEKSDVTSCDYVGWEDNEINLKKSLGLDTIMYAKKILDEHIPHLKAGDKLFIPAGYFKKTHNAMEVMLKKKGIATLKINGDGIELVLPNGQMERRDKNENINNLIHYFIKKYNISDKYPLAITGYTCVSRGISLMNRKNNDKGYQSLWFDFAILSYVENHAAVSQMAGRIKGNIRCFDWKPCKVYTTPKFNDIAIVQEKISRILPELAMEKIKNGEDPIISRKEIRDNCGSYISKKKKYNKYESKNYDHFNEIFTNFSELKEFLSNKFDRSPPRPRKPKKTIGNYEVTTQSLKHKGVKKKPKSISDNYRLLEKELPGDDYQIKGKNNYEIYPYYKDLDSPPEEVKYRLYYKIDKRW